MLFDNKKNVLSVVILILFLVSVPVFADETYEKHGFMLFYEYPFQFTIYLPESYHESDNFPVLYLLHGQGQSEKLWENLGIDIILDELISEALVDPMIVVMPRESFYYQNMDESEFPYAVVNSLIPLIDKTFKTDASKNARAVGGISRGALWAQKIAFENIDKFAAVGAHSLPNPFFSDYMLNKYIKQYAGYSVPALYIDTGNMDPYAKGSSDFSVQLFSQKIPHTLVVSQGTHDEDYWEEHLKDYIIWYGKILKKCF